MTQRRAISMEEVKKHNSEKDCWIIMHDLVYELPRDFLDKHPGGGDVITVLAGQECTDAFEDIAHSDSAREWADDYIIGYLEGSSQEASSKKTPLLSQLSASGGSGAGIDWTLVAGVTAALAAVTAFLVYKVKK
mmetsp:Transcript_69215/g.165966  ORF Transcript_69215/g.165966 Transcript_69215/m.165966 type:complete len:134 (+) Transcript_69215:73-474(+)|eukprot:CAMPEP_0178420510 /NCGR_PEP_ID=MMETSP0689_2-20121128/26168_1 /TAXON_ID=160604 /ORGANISM="Amphidinium massartii, Strain CS-259" /LENGTH=133 /DNA_ID=CAMNT_0020041991 /DNA_START=73 /DNA_END=474 /DNA_ORIENTATION=-